MVYQERKRNESDRDHMKVTLKTVIKETLYVATQHDDSLAVQKEGKHK